MLDRSLVWVQNTEADVYEGPDDREEQKGHVVRDTETKTNTYTGVESGTGRR